MTEKGRRDSHFDWLTHEDHWSFASEAKQNPQGGGRRRWPWLAAGLALVILLGLLWQRTREQVAEVVLDAQESVLADHHWLQEVMIQQDLELLPPLLSGRDREWVGFQLQRAAENEYFNRSAFGLTAMVPPQADVSAVEITPDLSTATLSVAQPYLTNSGVNVILEQTVFYRRGDNRWLQSAPDAQFWGGLVSNAGESVTTFYSERDADLGRRLALDFEENLQQLCSLMSEFDCPMSEPFTVRFETNPSYLAQMTEFPALVDMGTEIKLPAPTLVGRPQDETGYKVLRDGYLAAVDTAVIAHLLDYECCRRANLLQALIRAQLAVWQLGPPIEVDEFQDNQDYATIARTLRGSWQRPSATLAAEDGSAADLLVAYLHYLKPTLDFSPQMISLIETTNFVEWMGLNEEHSGRNWPQFMLTRVDFPPLNWPQQDVVFQCSEQLYLYNLASMEIAMLPTQLRLTAPMSKSDSGILIQGETLADSARSDPAWQARIWQRDESAVVFSRTLVPWISYEAAVPPDGGFLLLATVNNSTAPDNYFFGYRSLSTCSGNCTVNTMGDWRSVGDIAWNSSGPRYIEEASPSPRTGSRANEGWLSLTTEDMVRNLGIGRQPFWLNSAEYGFIAANRDGDDAIILGRFDEMGSEQVLVSAPHLLQMVAATAVTPPEALFIDSVIPHPVNTEQLFIIAADHTWDDRFILNKHFLLFDRRSNRVVSAFYLEKGNFNMVSVRNLSADGRWLVLTGFDSDLMSTILYILDLENESVRLINPPNFSEAGTYFDFSADGQWLILGTEWGLELIALDFPFQQRLPHDLSYCQGAAWVER